jgi:hypothetical protein
MDFFSNIGTLIGPQGPAGPGSTVRVINQHWETHFLQAQLLLLLLTSAQTKPLKTDRILRTSAASTKVYATKNLAACVRLRATLHELDRRRRYRF